MSNEASELFKRLVGGRAAVVLKEQGFRRRSQNFRLHQGANWGVVNFQKSTTSTRERILFTANLGVRCGRLATFFESATAYWEPLAWDCHWRKRIGEFLEEPQDKWWVIDGQTPLESIEAEVTDVLTIAIPVLRRYLDDRELRDLWLSRGSSGLTEMKRQEYLCVLLKELGPIELLEPALQELEEIEKEERGNGWLRTQLR